MKNDYIQDFVNASMFNNVSETRKALELGFNIKKNFNFQNPKFFFAALNTRDTDIVHLVLEYWNYYNDFLEKAKKFNSKIVLSILEPIILKQNIENNLDEKTIEKNKLKI